MRTAVVSDMHGNSVAFDAVLADLERARVDQVVCLGDVAQGGAQPAECVDRLQELRGSVVLGNSDAFLLSVESAAGSSEPVTERHLEVRAWSIDRLGPERLEYLATFQPTVEVELGAGRTLLGFHGSPRSFDEILYPETPEDEFRRATAGHSASLLAGGHVHMQWLRRLDESLFFNPGSVGLAYDRNQPEDDFRLDPWGEYAVVDSEGPLAVEFRRVPFDSAEVVRATLASGMPYAESRIREWTER